MINEENSENFRIGIDYFQIDIKVSEPIKNEILNVIMVSLFYNRLSN